MSETILKMLPTEVRVLDREKGIVEYVASSETIDGDGDKILVDGWKFGRMRKNAPFLDSHRMGSVRDVLGRVIGARVEDGALVEKVEWAIGLGNHEIDTAFRMTEAGFLKAVSVGFRPLISVARFSDRTGKKVNRNFAKEVAAYGVSADEAKRMNHLFVEQEQKELSAVTIGSNPDALLKSFEEGVLGEEDLAKLGFRDDDAMEFLTKAAEANEFEEADEVLKLLVEREMRRTMAEGGGQRSEDGGQKTEVVDAGRDEFLKRMDDVTSELPGRPSGGGDATRKVNGRDELLKVLGNG